MGPPDGVYYIEDELGTNHGSSSTIDFAGAEEEVTLVMPRIAGVLLTVPGVCTLPGGSPAVDVTVNTGAGRFVTSGSTNHIRECRTDGSGRFTLEGVPSGRTLTLYAETADRKFAGTATIKVPPKADSAFRISFPLVPTVGVEWAIEDDGGKPMKSKKFKLSPKLGEENFLFMKRRTVESDEQGRIKFFGIVPGLSYHLEEITPPIRGPVMVGAGGRLPWYDKVLVLAPKEQR